MDDRLLDILCCPTSRMPVRRLTDAEIASVNRAVAAGGLHTQAGGSVGEIRAGLVTRDGRTIYRIDDGIPVMLADEAIATDQLADFPGR